MELQVRFEEFYEMMIRKNSKIVVMESSRRDPPNYRFLATFTKNIEPLGYIINQDLAEVLLTLEDGEFIDLYDHVMSILSGLVDYDQGQQYQPMYPNFPHQVMNTSDAELYLNAIYHYIGREIGIRIIPDYEKEPRSPLLEKTKYRVLGLGKVEEIHETFENMMSSNTSITQTDQEYLIEYLREFKHQVELPDRFGFRELAGTVMGTLLDVGVSSDFFADKITSPNDILRIATVISGGDVSLALNCRYISFSRRLRRELLQLLESSADNPAEQMFKHQVKWIRLGERLHPGEYKKRYPKVIDAFDLLRDRKGHLKLERYNSMLEEAIRNKSSDDIISLLTERPGVFARRLDQVLRMKNEQDHFDMILSAWKKNAIKVPTRLLLDLISYFQNRNQLDYRVFFPKGKVAKSYVRIGLLPDLPNNVIEQVITINRETLVKRFSDLDSLGSCYIDHKLQNYMVPFAMRSSSRSLKPLVKGSKLTVNMNKTLRAFIFWMDGNETVDLDLSAIFYDKDWKYLDHISYTNLVSQQINSCHSGDLTSAPEGAAEYIDIDLESAKQNKYRYLVISVFSYSEQPFYEIPEASVGWMEREEPQSGEIFDARTVENKIDLTAPTRICIPMIVDLEEGLITWADMGSMGTPEYRNNLENNMSTLASISKALVELKRPNLYDLFTLHAQARGAIVDEKENAETIFSITEGITPYDLAIITAKFL